jgi:hypothetical protein
MRDYVGELAARRQRRIGDEIVDRIAHARMGARRAGEYRTADALRAQLTGGDLCVEDTEWGGMRLYYERGIPQGGSRYDYPGVMWGVADNGDIVSRLRD